MASERSASHLAPGYLVAAPGLRDPNFAGSLVLMTGHRRDGAMGFVVNRPAPMTVAGMLGAVDAALGGLARGPGAGEVLLVAGAHLRIGLGIGREALLRQEARLIGHLARALDPIAEIDIGQAFCRRASSGKLSSPMLPSFHSFATKKSHG